MGVVKFSLLVAVLAAAITGRHYVIDRVFSKPYPVPPPDGAIIITGASTGIGLHAAVTLAQKGYTVLAGVRKQADAESLKEHGIATLRPVILDVEKEESIDHAWAEIEGVLASEKLTLIGLVNNAGIALNFPVEFHSTADNKKVLQVNYFGPMYLTQKVLPTLRSTKGRIINISSVSAVLTQCTSGVYSASKRALEAISDTLRVELREFDVSVSIVQPAFVKSAIFGKITRLIDQEISPEIRAVYGRHYRDEKRASNRKRVSNASPPTVTTDAIYDALTNEYPRSRYVVANIDKTPAWVLMWVANTFPDRVFDYIIHALS